MALAYPPVPLVVPAFIGLVPLLVFIDRQPAGPAGRWHATRAGLVMGAFYFGATLYWIAIALWPESPLAVPAYFLTVAVLSGFTGMFGWAVHLTRERVAMPLALAAAVFWTAMEWIPTHFGSLAYPWLGLGYALAPVPVLAGAADLVGVRGLTFWIAAVNGMIAAAILGSPADVAVRARRKAVRQRAWALGFALAGAPAVYGAWRATTLELVPTARVVALQTAEPRAVLPLPAHAAADLAVPILARLTSDAGAGRPIDLVVWPEAALPVDLSSEPDLVRQVAAAAARIGAPVLVGAYGSAPERSDGTAQSRFNSAYLVGPDGPDGLRYDKRQLVPFVEWVPGRRPVSSTAGFERGEDGLLFRAGGHDFGVLICFESAFPGLARQYRRDGAGFLVNATNDAWFGREMKLGRTAALWQHPAHLVLRAIETRAGVVRSANVGMAMFIDPLGRVHASGPPLTEDARMATVMSTNGRTGYVRWGDWLPAAATAVAALVVAAATRRARKQPLETGSGLEDRG